MLTRARARSIGWAVILAVCFALTIALTFKVNAVKSQVRLTERKIAALRAEKTQLETEFETRSNQQQLTALNDVEFGYQAPTAGQYLESERQLASLGKPRGPGAPDMIRVASADAPSEDSGFPTMVNPLTGKALGAGTNAASNSGRSTAADTPAKGGSARSVGTQPVGVRPKTDRVARVTPMNGPAGLVQRLSHVEKTPRPLKTGKNGKVALEE